MAVKNELNAYTSPSTAEYQKLSLNVYANPPTAPAPITAIICSLLNRSVPFCTILRAKCVMVQNRKRMVNPLARALITFTAFAAVDA